MDLEVRYEDHKGKYLVAPKDNKGYDIRKGKGYKIIDVHSHNGEIFYDILTEKLKVWGFKSTSKTFLSVEDSQSRLREMKLERILGGTKEQTIYTDE